MIFPYKPRSKRTNCQNQSWSFSSTYLFSSIFVPLFWLMIDRQDEFGWILMPMIEGSSQRCC